jgi:hypothetical protein
MSTTTEKRVMASLGANKMRPSEIEETIVAHYRGRHLSKEKRNPSPMILGSPGSGKTSVLYHIADKILKVPRFTFQATLYDPTEIKGLPAYIEEMINGVMAKMAKFLRFEDMPSQPEGILIIDDLTHAAQQTQNAFMRLILEGKAGAWDLDGLFPVATGNRSIDRAGAKDLQTAMANRFYFIEFEDNYADWRGWAISADIHPAVVAYLGTPFGQEWLNKFDSTQQINPTQRTWEDVSNHMRVMSHNEPLMRKMIAGSIGDQATSKFMGWMKCYSKLPDLNRIMNGENIYPETIDLIYATISGLVAMAKQSGKRKAAFQRLMEYSVGIPDTFPELGVLLAKDLCKLDPAVFDKLDSKEWEAKYMDIVI